MELSMNDKIVLAHDLAVDLGERLNEGALTVDTDTECVIWGHADGLAAKRLYDLRDGRCSLAASMAFDVEAEEKELDRDIREMNELTSQ